jgi:hypothetical protein
MRHDYDFTVDVDRGDVSKHDEPHLVACEQQFGTPNSQNCRLDGALQTNYDATRHNATSALILAVVIFPPVLSNSSDRCCRGRSSASFFSDHEIRQFRRDNILACSSLKRCKQRGRRFRRPGLGIASEVFWDCELPPPSFQDLSPPCACHIKYTTMRILIIVCVRH